MLFLNLKDPVTQRRKMKGMLLSGTLKTIYKKEEEGTGVEGGGGREGG